MKKLIELLTIMIILIVVVIPIEQKRELTKNKSFKTSVVMQYCGMISHDVFSISSNIESFANVNLYYPIGLNQIQYRGYNINVIKVTHKELTVELVD